MSALRTKLRPAVAAEEVRHLPIGEDDAGQRLDNFLVRLCRGVPKSHLYRLIRSGQLRVNGRRQGADYRLQAGDSVRLPPIRLAAEALPSGREPGAAARERVRRTRADLARRLPVLHEDESLLAIDKPASVAVHGGSGVSSGVIEQLRAARPQARFLELVHRLDRETSGVLLLALRRAALVALHAQLRERGADKRYLAIVTGRWPLRTRTLAFALHRHEAPDGDRRVSVQAGGQEAVTRVSGLLRFELPPLGEFSLVEARLETGRTHQIRVHLAHAGCPIVGDPKNAYDTYLEQLLANAEAAVDKAVELGVVDRARVGVTGHSHGALMAANLLAHSDLFRAGVASSGGYNKTLTPFGFQNERRSFWAAPKVYDQASTFFHADKVNEPLLIVHGSDDANPGTESLQSPRLFQAIRGTGGTTRLVMLPFEPHWYTAQESNEHFIAEMLAWFDRYVKPAQAAGK